MPDNGGQPLDPDAPTRELPLEAKCQVVVRHEPHRHEMNWGDLAGAYICDGNAAPEGDDAG